LAESTSFVFVHTIELLGGLRLFGKVHHLWGRALHFVRQLIRADAGVKLGIVLLVFAPNLIQTLQQAELISLLGVGHAVGGLQMEQRRIALAELHALVSRRQETGAPLLGAGDWIAVI